MTTQVIMDMGDLFGALITRKINYDSELYNSASLFGLCLPELSDAPRDIFITPNVATANHTKEEKTQVSLGNTKLHINSPEPTSSLVVPTSSQKYLTLAPKLTHSALRSSNTVSEEYIINLSILAMKGVSSDVFRLDRKSPLVTIPGRSLLSLQGFLRQARSLFIIRTLLDSACNDFVCYSTDAVGLALGGQLGELLHLFDVSLESLQKSSVTLSINHEKEEEATDRTSCTSLDSIVVMWERTQLHRMFLSHLFTIVRPPACVDLQWVDFGAFVQNDETANSNDLIDSYLRPRAWVGNTGWNIFHSMLGIYDRTRNSACSVHTVPLFATSLFRNAAAFTPCDLQHETSVSLDFSRMILTAVVTRQVSAPLLLELKSKLYDLDAEFYTHNRVLPAELESSLLISVDALWRSCTDIDTSFSGGVGGRRAEQSVEFLLSALAWARGRVQLMLLAPSAVGVDTGAPQDSSATRKTRVGSLQVRDRVADEPGHHTPAAAGSQQRPTFCRQAVIDAFRAVDPDLILPLNEQDEGRVTAVKEKSLALQSSMQVEIERKISQWYMSFATLSDYYNEHAVSSRSLFSKGDSPSKIRETIGVVAESRVSLVRRRRDREAAQHADDNTTERNPNTETFLSGPLNTPRTVSKDLVEAAKDHIRAKYVSLMQEVEGRSNTAVWRNQRHDTLPQARADLANLFEQDGAELQRLRALKQRDSELYQRHFDDQLGVTPTSPLLTLLPVENSSSDMIISKAQEKLTISTEIDGVDLPEAESSKVTSVPDSGISAEYLVDSSPPVLPEQSDAECPSPPKFEDEMTIRSAEEAVADPLNCNAENVADVLVVDNVCPGPESAHELAASHSLVDIAPSLLGHAANTTTSADDYVLGTVQSLAQSVLLLASAHGLVQYSEEDLAIELKELLRDNPDTAWLELQSAVLGRAAQSTSNLHSLHSILMRSLGRAVLEQCRAINLASLHCLVNSSVDLLGHVQAVDNLLLVSPNSDFLMSLCTLMVDQHIQNIRVLNRQGCTNVSALSPQLRNLSNAELWNDEALQVGFTSVLASASTANRWKELGTLYSSLHTTAEANRPPESVGAATMRWTVGLFSSAPLTSLEVHYDAPWPVPAIISSKVLGNFGTITRRFLELGQLVALFRVVWGDLRLKRVVASNRKQVKGAHPPQVDRILSDSMRLVQQTVQHLFDYLSERVYVHQARFKLAVRRASSFGLDAVAHALNSYSEGLCGAALQLTSDEIEWLHRSCTATPLPGPGGLTAINPTVGLKCDVNGMLESCRSVLFTAKALSDDGGADPDTPPIDSATKKLELLRESSRQIHLYKYSIVQASKIIDTTGKSSSDLQPLIMRFEQ